jgi:hypothetical protein
MRRDILSRSGLRGSDSLHDTLSLLEDSAINGLVRVSAESSGTEANLMEMRLFSRNMSVRNFLIHNSTSDVIDLKAVIDTQPREARRGHEITATRAPLQEAR